MIRRVATLIGLSSALMVALPVQAAPAAQARLVHCSQDTCLRLSGHRPRATMVVRIAGQELAVAGSRDWVAIAPLWAARAWQQSAGGVLTLTYSDPQNGVESKEHVVLPPGALGRHVELASLVIHAS